MAYRPTKTMIRALIWLREHDGVGVLNRYGRVRAGGETASHIDPTTWLRLILAGYVEARPDERHLVLSLTGVSVAVKNNHARAKRLARKTVQKLKSSPELFEE